VSLLVKKIERQDRDIRNLKLALEVIVKAAEEDDVYEYIR